MMHRFLFVVFLLFGPGCFAEQAVLNSLTEKDGLTDNAVTCFFQDSRGVMWLGTNYGLNSFDGSEVKNFNASIGGNSIANDKVSDIKEANLTIWIATAHGLSSYNLISKKIENYYFDSKYDNLNRFYSLAIFGNAVLLATEDGVEVFDMAKHNFSHFMNPDNRNNNNRITKILVDRKKRIWLGSYNGVWQYDFYLHTFTGFTCNDNKDLGFISDIFEDHSGNIWVSTWSAGLNQLQPESKSVTSYLHFKNAQVNVKSISEQKTTANSYVLITNNNTGYIDFGSRSFTPLIKQEGDNNLLANASLVFVDRSNLLWISTEEGIKIYNPVKQNFKTTILNSAASLSTQGIAICPTNNGFLLGAEGKNAVMLFSNTVNLIKNYSNSIGFTDAITNIQKDRQNNYWLCTSNGLLILNSGCRKLKYFVHDDKNIMSLPKNFLNTVLFKRDGTNWLMPWRKGIWAANINTGQFTPVTTVKNDTLLKGANISKALEDVHGNIWFTGYDEGVIKYSPATGTIEQVISIRRLTNEFLRDNMLWTASAQEVFSINVNTGKIQSFPLPGGKNKDLYDFAIDDNGILWMTTKTGLVAFNTVSRQFRTYSSGDGLYKDVVNASIAKLSSGDLVIVGDNYATVFNPSTAMQTKSHDPLLFTSASTNDEERIATDNTFKFYWKEKNISLKWALLNYSNPVSNLYYYKLDGLNTNWQFTGNKGAVTFNSLAPGTYTFRYKASTSDGIMSEEKMTRLIVYPPFWQTWWFRSLVFFSGGCVFFAVVRYATQKKLKAKVLRLEKEQAVAKERQRISKDMHDDLGSGLTKIAIVSEVVKRNLNDAEVARWHLETIAHTSRELVDNLQNIIWVLNPKNDSLGNLAAYIREYGLKFFEPFNVKISFHYPDSFPKIVINEETRRNVFMAIKEVCNNIAKHAWCNTVMVNLALTDAGAVIMIQDDGKGFDEGNIRMFSNGLLNMKERMEQIGGTFKITSTVGRGTNVELNFPL